jgi:hypothetical protein
MAAKGRGSDSMLVHMTPEEVQSLQALALKNGGSLTINPDTGLPEANFLKKLLPAIAGAALNFFAPGVGTAVGGLFGLGGAAGAGIAIGGITTLATGSLSRGLMAGLGAYGGANLAGSLSNAGAASLTDATAANAYEASAGMTDAAAEKLGFASAEEAAQNAAASAARNFDPAQVSGLDKAAAGFKSVTSSGGAALDFAKNNGLSGLAAISPMMADQGVQTTTKRGDAGTIRRFSFDPYGQTYTSQGSYPADEEDRKASGGIVALAEGGGLTLPKGWGVAGGKYDDPNEKIQYFNQKNITPEQLLAANQGVTQTDIDYMLQNGYAGNTIAPGSNKYNQNINDYFTSNPNATYSDIQKKINEYGLNPADVKAAMAKEGLSGAAQFAAFNQNIGDKRNVDETYSGLKGLSSNINYWITNHPGATLNDFQNEMKKWELNEDDVRRATGKTSAELFTGPIQDVTNPAEGAGGSTGAGVEGGGTVVNPNGTITTSPRIPRIPIGGFTGMKEVRDAYTAGGGSLGYENPYAKDMDDFNRRFGNQTGDSKAAYDYLMGKGANNNAYPTKSGVEQIMRPYSEVSLGVPAQEGRPTQKYIFQGGKYVENPNYRPVSYNTKGERIVGLTTNEVIKGLAPFKTPDDYGAMYDFVTENQITEAQLAAALGISIPEARARIAAGKLKSTGGTGNTGNTMDADTSATYEELQRQSPGSANGGVMRMALGGLGALAGGGQAGYNLGGYSDGGRLLRGPGDGVSDSIPATIGNRQPARLADGEFVVPARIVSELGNGSTEAGARKLYAMMDRVQKARGKTTGKRRVATNTRADKYLPA